MEDNSEINNVPVDQINILINEFAESCQSIIYEDIIFVLEKKKLQKILIEKIFNDERFIIIGNKNNIEEVQLLSKKSFLRKLILLNIRLFNCNLNRISLKDFIFKIKDIFRIPATQKDIKILLKWSGKYFLAVYEKKNSILFPLSEILTKVNKKFLEEFLDIFIKTFGFKLRTKKSTKISRKFLEGLIYNFTTDIRMKDIILNRYGLLDGKIQTLEYLGKKYVLSRERIRQIEAKFWERVESRRHNLLFNNRWYLYSILLILILIISKKGKKIFFNSESLIINKFKFLSKFIEINFLKSENIGIYFLGLSRNIIKKIEQFTENSKSIKYSQILKDTTELCNGYYSENDMNILVNSILIRINRTMKKTDIVYLALKEIGTPAHFVEIAKVCKRLFPSIDFLTPRNIEATLSRTDKKFPWVWVGSRGIFALKEWGYCRPDKSLYDEVFEIIKKIYSETGKPISFTKIFAEVSKKRRYFNRKSLIIICGTHPKIEKVEMNRYIASEMEIKREEKSLLDLNDLDKKIRRFKNNL